MADTGSLHARRVLVVEDEAAIARLLTRSLGNEGYEVMAVSDGQRAIDALATERFDLVVLDVMLPKVDGFGVLKYIRTSTVANTSRVLMLTALGRDDDWLKGLRAGAHDYITKPFDHDELVETVGRLIDMTGEDLVEVRQQRLDRARLLVQLEHVLDSRPS